MTLSDESRQTVRQVGLVALLRAVQIAAGFLYVAFVPRTLGPDVFGQLVTLQTMSMWFSSIGGLGSVPLMTRFVPEFIHRGDRDGLRQLAGSLLTLRLTSGLIGALAYFGIVQAWLQDLDTRAVGLIAVTIVLRTTANLPFTVLLGLNQAARWEAADLIRRLLVLPLTYVGARLAGLIGACAAVGVVEGCVLCLGMWWSHEYVRGLRRVDRIFLRPFLQFSVLFFAANMLIVLFQQGGVPLVRLISGDYAEAAYYAIAFAGYLAGAQALWKLVSSFGPLFSSLKLRGETDALRGWIGRLLRMLALCGVVTAALLYSSADLLVAGLLGREYEPVGALLPWLAIAGLAAGPGSIARVLAVSFEQGRVSLVGAALQLVCFATFALLLIPRLGSLGGSVAVAAAAAIFSLYNTWQIRSSISYSMRQWAEVVALGAACSPLLWLWDGFGPLRFALFMIVFIAATTALGLVRLSEVRHLWRAMRSEPKTGRPPPLPGLPL